MPAAAPRERSGWSTSRLDDIDAVASRLVVVTGMRPAAMSAGLSISTSISPLPLLR